MAPWCSESRRQQKIFARVAVAEQRTPGFALRFDLELLEEAEMQGDPSVLMPCMHLMRLVNQRQMLRAFEFAFAGAGAEKRRPGGEEADDELLDLRLKKWLAGGGRVPAPPKEELVKWLLTWMVITPTTADSDSGKWPDWLVLMCGEKVAEYAIGDDNMDLAFDESGDASDPVYYEGNDNGDNDDRSGSSARKLRINEQKRRDAQAVRQTIADTLEYRDELNAMESRLKQAAIAAHRHQERLKRQARVVMGNIEKTPNGTIKLGSGPLSKKEMELILGSSRTGSAVYDLHGRRRSLEEADMVTKETALESAMRKVRRLVLSSKNGVE
ncbi:hypothetical protein PInf_003291 [Phytophthora infestans]|nr:hypothetical protein PInf_003291 [Phytophthora infestans]